MKASDARAGDLPIDGGDLPPAELAALLDARDQVLAQRGRGGGVETSTLATLLLVRIGATRVGLALEAVATVLPAVRTAPVPGAPPALIGLFAHDGAVHNLLAIEEALGLPPAARSGRPSAVVLRRDGPRIAVAVDEAIGIVQVPIAAPAESGDGGSALRFVAGDDDMPLLLPDIEQLAASLGIRRAAPAGGETT